MNLLVRYTIMLGMASDPNHAKQCNEKQLVH